MVRWLFLLALVISLSVVSCVKIDSSHDYLLGSNYQASWNPNFSGWNRLVSPLRRSWTVRNTGLGGLGRNSAYAASWQPNFSGWGRRSYWTHNTPTQDTEHKSVATSGLRGSSYRGYGPTWRSNFRGFRRPSVFSRSRRPSFFSRGRDPTWDPNFSGFRRYN